MVPDHVPVLTLWIRPYFVMAILPVSTWKVPERSGWDRVTVGVADGRAAQFDGIGAVVGRGPRATWRRDLVSDCERLGVTPGIGRAWPPC